MTLDLNTARQMLPLIKSIVSDIVRFRLAINRLAPEQERLDRHRRDLVWEERNRRYQLQEEVTTARQALTAAIGELKTLGVSLIDDVAGEVDFPTKINGRSAAFTWKAGEDGLTHWHYSGEEQLRPIPADWSYASATAVRSRRS
jgi:hypothetical protein